MKILGLIKSRRSIRKFKAKTVSRSIIRDILEAGRWAPSGLNNQPWRFMVLEKQNKDDLCQFTHYRNIIKSADKAILVFLDKSSSYNYQKDLMAIGACIQNMLLYIHSLRLGACWLGEILNQKNKVQKHFKLVKNLELAAVLAIGVPATTPKATTRKNSSQLIIK